MREEQKAKKLNANSNKSYSNSSRGSSSSIKHKKKAVTSPVVNKAKNDEPDLLIDLTDNTSKMDLVGPEQEGTDDPFDGFDSDYVQPKVTKPTKISTPPARRSFESKATNVSLQAATLAAVGNNPRQKQNSGASNQQPVAKKPNKTASSKRSLFWKTLGKRSTRTIHLVLMLVRKVRRTCLKMRYLHRHQKWTTKWGSKFSKRFWWQDPTRDPWNGMILLD